MSIIVENVDSFIFLGTLPSTFILKSFAKKETVLVQFVSLQKNYSIECYETLYLRHDM